MLRGGLSKETLFTLSHTLRSLSQCVRCLLKRKGCAWGLAGNLGNVPVEKLFNKSRFIAGGNSHLDGPSFNHAQRTLSLG